MRPAGAESPAASSAIASSAASEPAAPASPAATPPSFAASTPAQRRQASRSGRITWIVAVRPRVTESTKGVPAATQASFTTSLVAVSEMQLNTMSCPATIASTLSLSSSTGYGSSWTSGLSAPSTRRDRVGLAGADVGGQTDRLRGQVGRRQLAAVNDADVPDADRGELPGRRRAQRPDADHERPRLLEALLPARAELGQAELPRIALGLLR